MQASRLWRAAAVALQRDGQMAETLHGTDLTFATRAGETIVLSPAP